MHDSFQESLLTQHTLQIRHLLQYSVNGLRTCLLFDKIHQHRHEWTYLAGIEAASLQCCQCTGSATQLTSED